MPNIPALALGTLGGALLLAVILLAIAVGLLIWSRHARSLFWRDFWVNFPWFGMMAKWCKMTEGTGGLDFQAAQLPTEATYVDRTLSVPAEKHLYFYYTELLAGLTISKDAFANAREFLKLSHQGGRRPMSHWIWAFLIVLTVAEAVGTGLLLAPLMSKAITPNLAVVVGSVIAFAIAGVALVITHGAGEDLFKNSLLAKVRHSYRQNGGFRRQDGSKAGETIRPIGPDNNQTEDGDNDAIARLAARIQATSLVSMSGKYLRISASVVFIVLFGVFTTAYRHYLFNKDLDTAAVRESGDTTSDYTHLFSTPLSKTGASQMPLPDDVANAATQSASREQSSIASDTTNANNAGILLLALIYVFTQFLGVLTGYKYSFFNTDGLKAYRETWGETTYEGFLRIFVEPVCKRGELRLRTLQSRLAHINPTYGERRHAFDFLRAYIDSLGKHEISPSSERLTPSIVDESKNVGLSGMNSHPTKIEQTSIWKEQEYDRLAALVLSCEGKSEQQAAIFETVQKHGLGQEQQAHLADAIRRLRSARKKDASPTVTETLLRAVDDD